MTIEPDRRDGGSAEVGEVDATRIRNSGEQAEHLSRGKPSHNVSDGDPRIGNANGNGEADTRTSPLGMPVSVLSDIESSVRAHN